MLYKLKDLEKQFKLSRYKIKQLIENKELKTFKLGNKYFFRKPDIENLMLKQTQKISARGLSKVFGVSYMTILKAIKSKKIKGVKVGREYIIDRDELNNVFK